MSIFKYYIKVLYTSAIPILLTNIYKKVKRIIKKKKKIVFSITHFKLTFFIKLYYIFNYN